MKLTDSKTVTCQFVSRGRWAHRLSPFASLGLGFQEIDSEEVVFSSAWLWQKDPALLSKPRVSMGYPEEYNEYLQQGHARETLQQVNLDLWLVRSLMPEELDALVLVLKTNSDFRLIIAVHHLLDWQSILNHSLFEEHKLQSQIQVSFLPLVDQLSPVLKPQEVIWELEKKNFRNEIQILAFPEIRSRFETTLDIQKYAQFIKLQNPMMIRIFKWLDRIGLSEPIYFLEIFFGSIFDFKIRRVGDFLRLVYGFFVKYLKILLFPTFKLYWFFSYQFQKRILKRISKDEN